MVYAFQSDANGFNIFKNVHCSWNWTTYIKANNVHTPFFFSRSLNLNDASKDQHICINSQRSTKHNQKERNHSLMKQMGSSRLISCISIWKPTINGLYLWSLSNRFDLYLYIPIVFIFCTLWGKIWVGENLQKFLKML